MSRSVFPRLRTDLAFLFTALFALLAGAHAAPDEIVFTGYNVENYLIAEKTEGGVHSSTAPKPEEEKQALIKVIQEINPDILGVCEMGSPAAFDDFKKRLAGAGLGYTDFEYVQAADQDRHLALLSRFPITSRQSVTDASYELNGQQQKVRRGFLDVTIKIKAGLEIRFVGAHLKSKRAAEEGEALLRRNEAHLLRQHVEEILAKDPSVKLMVYGDFNDTKNEPPIHEIAGRRNAADGLSDLWLKDNVGDRWTHYWKTADEYSRIDYIFTNRALFPEIVLPKCRVYRSDFWNDASDHRPVVATIRTAPRE